MGKKVITIDILVENEMFNFSSPNDAEFLQRFFKTGPGQYGEGDKFLGVRNPQIRSVAKKYYNEIANSEVQILLNSKWHEVRLCALVIMTLIMTKADISRQTEIYNIYLRNITKNINLELLEKYSNSINNDGMILLSGFYNNDISDFEKVSQNHNLNITKKKNKENWACIFLEKC